MQKKLVTLALLILSGCESYSENKIDFLAEEESYKMVIPEKLKKIKKPKKYAVTIDKNKIDSIDKVREEHYLIITPPQSVNSLSDLIVIKDRHNPESEILIEKDIISNSIKNFLDLNKIQYRENACRECIIDMTTNLTEDKSFYGNLYRKKFKIHRYNKFHIVAKTSKKDPKNISLAIEVIEQTSEERGEKGLFYKKENKNFAAIRLLNELNEFIYENNLKTEIDPEKIKIDNKILNVELAPYKDSLAWKLNINREQAWYLIGKIINQINFTIEEQTINEFTFYIRPTEDNTYKEEKGKNIKIKKEDLIYEIYIKQDKENSIVILRNSNSKPVEKEMIKEVNTEFELAIKAEYMKEINKIEQQDN